jgi:hypothetical protein
MKVSSLNLKVPHESKIKFYKLQAVTLILLFLTKITSLNMKIASFNKNVTSFNFKIGVLNIIITSCTLKL